MPNNLGPFTSWVVPETAVGAKMVNTMAAENKLFGFARINYLFCLFKAHCCMCSNSVVTSVSELAGTSKFVSSTYLKKKVHPRQGTNVTFMTALDQHQIPLTIPWLIM